MTNDDQQFPSIALIGKRSDPGFQLCGEALALEGVKFVAVQSLSQAPPATGRYVFASQYLFLAELAGVAEISGEVEVIIRRRQADESIESWEMGMAVLSSALKQLSAEVELSALSAAACRDISKLIPFHIRHRKLRRNESDPPTVLVSPETDTVVRETAPDTPALPISQMSWSRLYHRARPKLIGGAGTDFDDVVAYCRGDIDDVAPPAAPVARPRRVLFIVSNGIGLGHLTRCLAIATAMQKACPCEFVFWSYSKAAIIAQQAGHSVILRNTAEHLQMSLRDWAVWESSDLVAFLRHFEADDIVLDGSTIGPAVTQALLSPGVGRPNFIWIRRGLWQSHADLSPLEDAHLCDLVILPGDVAEDGNIKHYTPEFTGLGHQVSTAPVCATKASDVLSRRQARKALKQSRWGALCLVNLGGDALTNQGFLSSLLIRASNEGKVRFIWAQSPFSHPIHHIGRGIVSTQLYPVARYLNAFDGIITTAGYNSFHEMISLTDVPLLFAPVQHSRLDDQAARADFAENKNIARVFRPQDSNASLLLTEFLGQVATKRRHREKFVIGNGAKEAAEAILALGTRKQQSVST